MGIDLGPLEIAGGYIHRERTRPAKTAETTIAEMLVVWKAEAEFWAALEKGSEPAFAAPTGVGATEDVATVVCVAAGTTRLSKRRVKYVAKY